MKEKDEYILISHGDGGIKTQELVEKIKPIAQGIHIQALGWEKHVPTLIKNLGI